MEKKINSQKELFNRLLPALRTKKHELIASGIKIVNEYDIWNYNKVTNWVTSSELTLATMVDNILNTENNVYEEYVIRKMNKMNRNE